MALQQQQQQQQEEDWNLVSEKMIDMKIDNDKYQLVEELGRGSYGCLFLGQCLIDNSYVAIKILSKKGLNEQQLQLQQLEIDIQSSMKHSNVLKLNHTVQRENYIFMIMELCDGGDLFEFVIQNKQQQEDDNTVKNAFIQILDAIEYMHSLNIYHRDIKLENILLQSNGKDWICKVADFGLATKDRYSIEFGCGSTTYLAPEHFGSEEDEDDDDYTYYDVAASDVWSLGILLLALLFGRNPWEEATLMDPSFAEFKLYDKSLKYQLFPQLSNACLNLLLSILNIDPKKRPTVSEIKFEFTRLEKLTINYEDDTEEEDEDDIITIISPLDIHPVQPNKSNKASYDSAIFSQDGRSWSDIVEEDEQFNSCDASCQYKDVVNNDNEEEEIFIHDQEKESWWL